MPLDQSKISPIALQVQGDPVSGEVWLHYKTGSGTATSIQLSSALLAETVLNLTLCAAQSQNQEVRKVAQLFAIRNLKIATAQGPLLILHQELECGLAMATTLDTPDAERLQDELQSSLAYIRSHGSSAPH